MFLAFLLQRKRFVLLILYLLVSLFLMIVSSSTALRAIRGTAFGLFGSVSSVIADSRRFSADLWDSVRKMRDLRRELQVAYEKIQLLQDAGIAIGTLRSENEQLKDLLGYQKRLPWRAIPAQIIAKDPRYYYNTVIVNKGRNDGVSVHMPVIAWQDGQSGVVGKVVEAGTHASKILLLTDPNSYISGMIRATGYSGLVRGGGSRNQHLQFLYVDRNASVNFGDMVVSSGQGGLFPRGISIGLVMSVEDARYGLYYREIKVLPVIDFNKLESVFIVDRPVSEEILRMRETRDE